VGESPEQQHDNAADHYQGDLQAATVLIGINPERQFDPVGPCESEKEQCACQEGSNRLDPKSHGNSLLCLHRGTLRVDILPPPPAAALPSGRSPTLGRVNAGFPLCRHSAGKSNLPIHSTPGLRALLHCTTGSRRTQYVRTRMVLVPEVEERTGS